jgi:hypothetical protein
VNILDDENLIINDTEKDADRDLLALRLIVDNIHLAEESPAVLLLPSHQYIEALSKINVVFNRSLGGHIMTIDDHFPSRVPMGNTRDYPSLFQFKCPNHIEGCKYKNPVKTLVADHAIICKPKKPDPSRPLQCDRDGCESKYASRKSLNKHNTSPTIMIGFRRSAPSMTARNPKGCSKTADNTILSHKRPQTHRAHPLQFSELQVEDQI